MTNRELIEKYRRKTQKIIMEHRVVISQLEEIEDRLAALTQKDYEWDSEIDKRLETIQSTDINFEEPIIVMPERIFHWIIRWFFIALITILSVIEAMIILKG